MNKYEFNKLTQCYERTEKYNSFLMKCNTKWKPDNITEYRSIKIQFHKRLPKYQWKKNVLINISKAFNGAGFTLVAKKYVLDRVEKDLFNSYDINSAYQATLINDTYILSNKFKTIDKEIELNDFIKKYKNKKYICFVEIDGIKPKYPDYDYNIINKQLYTHLLKDKINKVGWLCDIDINNFIKLYNFYKFTIKMAYIFKDTGKLNVKDFIIDKYNKLHELKGDIRKNFKMTLHICTYGKSAQINRHNLQVRSKYVIIAIYQAAYVRQKMINLFLKYKNFVSYIDTDGIFIESKIKPKIAINDNIGSFKCEHKKVYMYIMRIKAYILYSKGHKEVGRKWSGIATPLKALQIRKLKKYGYCYTQEKVKKKVLIYKIINPYIIGNNIKI